MQHPQWHVRHEIKSGQKEKGTEDILTKCTPALNKLVNPALELDDFTDKVSSEAVRNTILYAVVGIIFIIFLYQYSIFFS